MWIGRARFDGTASSSSWRDRLFGGGHGRLGGGGGCLLGAGRQWLVGGRGRPVAGCRRGFFTAGRDHFLAGGRGGLVGPFHRLLALHRVGERLLGSIDTRAHVGQRRLARRRLGPQLRRRDLGADQVGL